MRTMFLLFLLPKYTSSLNQNVRHYSKNNFPKLYNAKTLGQKEYKSSIYNLNHNLIICNGPAGCGKTSLACDFSIQNIKNKNYQKIIITRPTVTIQENLGHLPGTINEKMYPWTLPIFDIFNEYFTKNEIESFIKDGIIEISPLGFIQGRTFKNSIIIADEMQNSSIEQMYMLLTRIGVNSKMIVNGDLNQNKNKNGLNDLISRLKENYLEKNDMNENGIDLIEMNKEDIVRHKVVTKIIELYE